jgi:hypothetical protein
MSKYKMKRYKFILIIYLSFLVVFFFVFIRNNNYLTKPEPRLYADTLTYYHLSNQALGIQSLIGISQNLLGPLVVIHLTNKNVFLAFLFNMFIFLYSLGVLFRTYGIRINKEKLLFYLLINPLLFVSLLLINKELFSLISTMFFLSYDKSKKKNQLLISCIFAIFTRWQHLAIFIFFLIFKSRFYLFRKNNLITILLIVLFINTMFVIIFEQFSNVYATNTVISQKEKTGILIDVLVFAERHFLYIFALPFKICLNLFGNIFRVINIFNPVYILSDPYNNFFILGHQISFLFVAVRVIRERKNHLTNDFFFLSLLFCIFYSITKMIQYRYFYVVYFLWSFVLSIKGQSKKEIF